MAEWWKEGIVYQVYPRSFQDTDGDGIGDLQGVARRLDYLKDLGVDAVWLSPIFVSPMADFGYDIADYTGVDPMFGTLADFDEVVARAHGLGLKLILDFVPNHTSDRHPWFVQSRSSRDDPRRDWYIWRDPAPDGGPPNNWLSNFGGGAWAWDQATGQYYYHAFLKEQPDLNWRNPEVRAAMHDVLRFWLDRGVDGFRVDVIWHLIKDADFRDNPPNPAALQLLLADLTDDERNASWHVVAAGDEPGASTRFSAGAALAPALRLLPGGRIPASVFARFPRATERAYRWVVAHRGLFGHFVPARARRWADRVIAAHGGPPLQ